VSPLAHSGGLWDELLLFAAVPALWASILWISAKMRARRERRGGEPPPGAGR